MRVAQSIKGVIDSASDIVSGLRQSMNFFYRGTVSKDELNKGAYLGSNNASGIRGVLFSANNSGAPQAMSLVCWNTSVCYAEILVGAFTLSDDGLVVNPVTVKDFGGKPGISVAVRFNVRFDMYDDPAVVTGISPWRLLSVADYEGLIQSGAQGGSSKTWAGSREEYEAIAVKDPETIYCITE